MTNEVITHRGFKIVFLPPHTLAAYRNEEYMRQGVASYSVTVEAEDLSEPLRQLTETIDSMSDEGEFRQELAGGLLGTNGSEMLQPSEEVWKFTITQLGDSARCTIGNIRLLSRVVTFLPQLERLTETLATPGGLYEVVEEAKVEGPELSHQKVTFGDFLIYPDLGYLLPAGPGDDRRPSNITEVTDLVRQLLPLLTREDFIFDHGRELFSCTKKGSMAYTILHRAKYEKRWPVVIRYMESDRKEFGEVAFKSALDSCISSDLLTTVE